MITAVRETGSPVLWICDPMHGNTESTADGTKTRRFDNIVTELETAFSVHAVALVAVPIFALNGQIAWLPAAALSCGFFVGAAVGARLAVRGGERVIRPVLAVAVIAMAGRMFGLY